MKTNYYYQCPPDDFIMRLMRSSKGFIIISEDGRVVCSERATLTPQMTTAWNEYCHIHNQDDIDGTIIDFWRYLRSFLSRVISMAILIFQKGRTSFQNLYSR